MLEKGEPKRKVLDNLRIINILCKFFYQTKYDLFYFNNLLKAQKIFTSNIFECVEK